MSTNEIQTALTTPKIILQPAVAKLQKYSECGSELHKYTIAKRPVAQFRKTKDKVKAEYALRDVAKPIGVSDFELGQALPNDLRSSLPSIEEIEAELEMNEHEF